MSIASVRWMEIVARNGCVVGRRHGQCAGAVEVHHVAEGSGLRSEFSVVGLCAGHHRGPTGLHGGIGTKGFIRIYRPPGDSEYGLLVWLCEDLARAQTLKAVA